MYIDPFSLRSHAQGRVDELARSYSNARHDQEWLTTKVGRALRSLRQLLSKGPDVLQPKREVAVPVPVPVTQSRIRR